MCEKGFFENKNVYHTKYMLTSVSRVNEKDYTVGELLMSSVVGVILSRIR